MILCEIPARITKIPTINVKKSVLSWLLAEFFGGSKSIKFGRYPAKPHFIG